MKRKTSVSLSEDVLAQVDRYAGSSGSRSAYIERVLRWHLRRRARAELDARDRELLDASADRLTAEAEEVLADQASWIPDDAGPE
jgi:metal-responsive CopG/Arc/MetJ family transcriptional regulator